MSVTLFDLIVRIQTELGTLRTGNATGGSTSTLIDTNGLKLSENDYWNEGSLFILSDASYSSTDISKTFYEITDFSYETKTVSLYSSASEAIASGDYYGIATRRYPLAMLIQKVNNVLMLDGDIPVEDNSLTTVEGQLVYTLPEAVSVRDLRQVNVSTNKSSTATTAPYWRPVVNWTVEPETAGTAGYLVLQYPLPAGYTLQLFYAKEHSEMRYATDYLHDAIHPDRVVFQVCADAVRWYKDKTRLPHLQDTIENLELKAQRAKDKHPLPPMPTKQSKVIVVSRTLDAGGRWYGRRW